MGFRSADHAALMIQRLQSLVQAKQQAYGIDSGASADFSLEDQHLHAGDRYVGMSKGPRQAKHFRRGKRNMFPTVTLAGSGMVIRSNTRQQLKLKWPIRPLFKAVPAACPQSRR